MADISKKIFSIDPEPDEDRILEFPPMPVDRMEPDAKDQDPLEDTDPPAKRKPIHLHPVDELTDSEIVESIKSASPVPAPSEDAPDVPEADLVLDEEIIAEATEMDSVQLIEDQTETEIIRPTVPDITGPAPSARLVAAVAPRSTQTHPLTKTHASAIRQISDEKPPVSFGLIGSGLLLLSLTMMAAVGFVILGQGQPLTATGLMAFALVCIVPLATIGLLWSAMRTLRRIATASDDLRATAERLMHADDTVASRVASLSASIRTELAGVDAHLAQTQSHLQTVTEQAATQGTQLADMTEASKSGAVELDNAIAGQREQFHTLLSEFEVRLQSLSQSIERHAGQLDITGRDTATRIEASAETLSGTVNHVNEQGDSLSASVETANETLRKADERLTSLSDMIAERTAQLDQVYDSRADHLSDLSDRIGKDADQASLALTQQADQLAAIDAQIISTEQRLNALLTQARETQDTLSSRLSDIEQTLSDADRRSRTFTADMSDRINDSVAQTRRELSVMEGELRALQSRMEEQRELDLGIRPEAAIRKAETSPGRIHLQPLDTDFPPVEPQPLDIPDEPEDNRLDLSEIIETDRLESTGTRRAPQSEVVHRPQAQETDQRRGFGLSRRRSSDDAKTGGWRWRDMLGSIDPLDDPTSDTNTHQANARSTIDRPPPGMPLQPPNEQAASAKSDITSAADGSDVVARLCEVNLAPSAIVDEGTIYEAAALRQTKGTGAQNACVAARLDAPLDHLRQILEGDLEFKLRAESFRRDYEERLATVRGDDALQAKLGSATGRAYLLCSAALHPA